MEEVEELQSEILRLEAVCEVKRKEIARLHGVCHELAEKYDSLFKILEKNETHYAEIYNSLPEDDLINGAYNDGAKTALETVIHEIIAELEK